MPERENKLKNQAFNVGSGQFLKETFLRQMQDAGK